MPKRIRTKNIKNFFQKLEEIRKYLLLIDANLSDWEETKDEYLEYDADGIQEWEKYKNYEMVLACLESNQYKEHLWQNFDIRHEGYHPDKRYEDADDIKSSVIYLEGKYFMISYFERYYFDEIDEVRPEQEIVYIPIDNKKER